MNITEESELCGRNLKRGYCTFIGSARIGGEPHIRERPKLRISTIGDNNWIGENSIVKANSQIGNNNMIMGLVNIGHHCIIGNKNEIGTGTTVCGYVTIGDRNKIKVQTAIRNRVSIGDDTLIGMGSNVVSDVPTGKTVKGNPAK